MIRVTNKIRVAAPVTRFVYLFKDEVKVSVLRLDRPSGDINPRLLSIKQLFSLN